MRRRGVSKFHAAVSEPLFVQRTQNEKRVLRQIEMVSLPFLQRSRGIVQRALSRSTSSHRLPALLRGVAL
jgi:hypothetical protein